ncbi:ClpXP protease specificity-enhancing factor [Xenophilus sp. Marseille-Q4582]|uniref:ClpXP protease specificity-enhancing factor n=1 Tax=Xenophilus sp. Marseille-Q4582 TaxID=2866600 RepID=UPI001CE3F7F8|nr:ClpXP protease specificity-enhancing factor [Xenophilus sp. Marseille-Q4582]
MINALESSSLRPYLIRALYEWCTDNGFTPYLAVQVDETVQVPREYVKNGEIVLNVSYDATSSLKLGNDYIEFKARFAGTARDISVPVGRVVAIYARENGQGMAFPSVVAPVSSDEPAASPAEEPRVMQLVADEAEDRAVEPGAADVAQAEEGPAGDPPKPGGNGGRPALKRVK